MMPKVKHLVGACYTFCYILCYTLYYTNYDKSYNTIFGERLTSAYKSFV